MELGSGLFILHLSMFDLSKVKSGSRYKEVISDGDKRSARGLRRGGVGGGEEENREESGPLLYW